MKVPDIYFEEYWGMLNAANDGGTYHSYLYEDENGRILHRFIKRPTNILPDTYDILSPTGFSGPVILDCSEKGKAALVRNFDRNFQKYCEENSIAAEYIRFSPWIGNHEDFRDVYELKHHGYTTGIDLTTDFFHTEFSKERRRRINRAEESGVRVQFDFEGDTLDEFYRLYNLMYDKNDTEDPEHKSMLSRRYMSDAFRMCKGHIFIASAAVGMTAVSSTVYIHSDRFLHSYLTGNDPAFYQFNANSVVILKACEWGRDNGKIALHQGGARNEGIFSFKKQFARNGVYDFHVGHKIRLNELYDRLIALKGKANDRYFPAYRE